MGIPLIHHTKDRWQSMWISDLHQLNKVIRSKQYPLPIITDILCKHSGYKFFTKLGVSMQYYRFELDKESQDLCTIIMPFGTYKYLRLPMGLKCSPDIAQAVMELVLSGIEDANVYINDVSTFSSDWNHHVNLLATILHQLCKNWFTINPLKCEWAIKETDWLDYWLTPQGLKPQKKKIDAIFHMDCPCNTTELCMFIGCVNYYSDMWSSHAYIFQPLTDQSGLKKKLLLNRQVKCKRRLTKCVYLWLPMLLQLTLTTISGLIYMLVVELTNFCYW
jgi:hypothetical protein